jgi:hypothetical protein
VPIYLVATTDDQLGLAKESIVLYNKWLDARQSVELQLYAKVDHGFDMRKQDLPTDSMDRSIRRVAHHTGILRMTTPAERDKCR